MKRNKNAIAIAGKNIGIVYLIGTDEKVLMRNKRTFQLFDLSTQVFTFKSGSEALLNLMQPGQVPEVIIVSENTEDMDIDRFMHCYEHLPQWIKLHSRVYFLKEPIRMDECKADYYYHHMLHKTMHAPFCIYEMMDERVNSALVQMN